MDHVDIISQVDHISAVSPLVSTSKQVVYANNNTSVTVNGVLPVYAQVNNASVTVGTWITEEANTNRDKVAVLGPTVVTNLFGTEDPIGKTIRIGNVLFTVVGVLKEK